jgi:hypothetical protein
MASHMRFPADRRRGFGVGSRDGQSVEVRGESTAIGVPVFPGAATQSKKARRTDAAGLDRIASEEFAKYLPRLGQQERFSSASRAAQPPERRHTPSQQSLGREDLLVAAKRLDKALDRFVEL